MVDLDNVWVLFYSLISVTAPLLGTLVGFLTARLFVALFADFFQQVRDAALKFLTKGG